LKSKAQDWPKIYGDNFHSIVRDLSETYDRGYIITGYTYDQTGWPEYDWILKIDINGGILWDKRYGDGDYSNGMSSSCMTSDNGIICCGATSKYSGNYDPTFIKMDVCGEIEWCRVLISPDQNYGTDVIQISDGSYIGLLTYYGIDSTYSRISLVKMDQLGEPIWIQQLAQQDSLIFNEEGGYLYLTSDTNYLVSGECFHPGLKPLWIDTDTSGNQIWDLIWQGGYGSAYQVVENNNDYFYSSGAYAETGRPITPTIFKFDNEGSPINKQYLFGDSIDGGYARSLCYYNDSTLYTGIIWGSPSSSDIIYFSEIFKLDTLSNLLDRRLLLNESQAPECILRTSDNKILVGGSYVVDGNWDIHLWKMNQDLENDTLYTQPITYDSLCRYQIISDTVDLDCGVFVNVDELPTKEEYESTIKISPNPAREWIALTLPDNVAPGNIELKIYNNFGQKILNKAVIQGNRMISCNISGFSSGFYLAVCKDSRGKFYKGKFIVGR
jgi:hypothetical protein